MSDYLPWYDLVISITYNYYVLIILLFKTKTNEIGIFLVQNNECRVCVCRVDFGITNGFPIGTSSGTVHNKYSKSTHPSINK